MSISSMGSLADLAITGRVIEQKSAGELRTLYSKLHLEAVANAATAAEARVKIQAAPPPPHGEVTGLFSGLRSLLDGGISIASEGAHIAAKAATAYATGGGIGAIGTALFNRVA